MTAAAPAHRIPMIGGWSLWRTVGVRGAGFPAREVLALAAPAAAAAADRLLAAEGDEEAARAGAIAALQRQRPAADREERRAIARALRYLRSERPPPRSSSPAGPELALLEAAGAARARSRQELDETLSEEQSRICRELRRIASDPRFREAVLWQNRDAVHSGLDPLLRQPAGASNSQTRRHEWLVASYLQRYAVKNETIGFFGPIAWGAIAPRGVGIEARPGERLIERRTVYFEHWAIDQLASRLSADDELLPDLAPRRMPTVRVDGTTLHYGTDRAAELPELAARLLAAADGSRPAREIARTLVSDPALGLAAEEEVYDLLGQLVRRGLLLWELEVPVHLTHPERALRQLLAGLDREAPRRALAALDALDTARARVAAAAGDPVALDGEMGELAATFRRHTGQAATRAPGQVYAGRTLVYEDCRRDLELTVGCDLLSRIAPALELVLLTARWYTFAIATRFRAALDRVHREIAGGAPVAYARFYQAVTPLLPAEDGTSDLVEEVLRELQAAWLSIAGIESGARRVELASASIAAEVREAFAAPHPGWPGARFHSPDLLLAAESPGAAARGAVVAVLGEMHTGVNTLLAEALLKESPDRDALIAALEADVSVLRLEPVIPKERATRADNYSVCLHHLDVELGRTRSWRRRDRVLAAADLVVTSGRHGPLIETRDGRHRFDAVAFFEQPLAHGSRARFALLPAQSHLPRLSIDGLVVAREQWRFAPAAVPFAQTPRGAEQFAAARRWARAVGLPRWVFVRAAEERKPVFVDLDSPIYVELLARLARRTSRLTVSEMLPAIDQTWLPDREGQTYTAELRVVAVDPEPWRTPE